MSKLELVLPGIEKERINSWRFRDKGNVIDNKFYLGFIEIDGTEIPCFLSPKLEDGIILASLYYAIP